MLVRPRVRHHVSSKNNEGELRTRRPRPKPTPASQSLLKVDPKTNGSQHLVIGTEEIAPGASNTDPQTLGPYRDCAEIRCKVVHDVTLGAVSIGSFEVSR